MDMRTFRAMYKFIETEKNRYMKEFDAVKNTGDDDQTAVLFGKVTALQDLMLEMLKLREENAEV